MDVIANIDGQSLDFAVDLGPHRNLFRRADLSRGIDRKVNIAQLDRSGGGTGGDPRIRFVFLNFFPVKKPTRAKTEKHRKDNPIFHFKPSGPD